MKVTWNLTTLAAAGATAVGLIRGPRWLAYVGGAALVFYAVVYPNLIATAK
jgi:hypothetical protein